MKRLVFLSVVRGCVALAFDCLPACDAQASALSTDPGGEGASVHARSHRIQKDPGSVKRRPAPPGARVAVGRLALIAWGRWRKLRDRTHPDEVRAANV